MKQTSGIRHVLSGCCFLHIIHLSCSCRLEAVSRGRADRSETEQEVAGLKAQVDSSVAEMKKVQSLSQAKPVCCSSVAVMPVYLTVVHCS